MIEAERLHGESVRICPTRRSPEFISHTSMLHFPVSNQSVLREGMRQGMSSSTSKSAMQCSRWAVQVNLSVSAPLSVSCASSTSPKPACTHVALYSAACLSSRLGS